MRSVILVAVQVVAIVVMAGSGKLVPSQFWLVVLGIAGVLLAVWGIATIRLKNLRAVPEVKPGSTLVRRGPYRLIRHPMYAGLLVVGIVWMISDFSWLRLGAMVVLTADLLVKMHYEERFLQAAFPEYADYKQQTRKLIPFVY
ncbi:MAG TPA: isoprenylcysteine carboxylmethyltransferase family protein [bacterium]|jgi:protein-S-isoprenylcysteine O-methyltransferase Ste14